MGLEPSRSGEGLQARDLRWWYRASGYGYPAVVVVVVVVVPPPVVVVAPPLPLVVVDDSHGCPQNTLCSVR